MHNQRLTILAELNWHPDETAGRHKVCSESCSWISGKISGVDWHAWIGEVSGMVYLHGTPATIGEYDFPFSKFVELVRNGWPTKTKQRGLFDEG